MIIPVIDASTFMAVHDLRVWGTVMPKYWLTIQKPESLTWEKAVPPQHKATTSTSGE